MSDVQGRSVRARQMMLETPPNSKRSAALSSRNDWELGFGHVMEPSLPRHVPSEGGRQTRRQDACSPLCLTRVVVLRRAGRPRTARVDAPPADRAHGVQPEPTGGRQAQLDVAPGGRDVVSRVRPVVAVGPEPRIATGTLLEHTYLPSGNIRSLTLRSYPAILESRAL